MNRTLIILTLVLAQCFLTQPVKVSLPVSQDLMQRLSLSIDNLLLSLYFFDTKYENKEKIHKDIVKCKTYLKALNAELSRYNNVILGGDNKINGNTNFVVGNLNTIIGNNNWVFASKFSGDIDGVLVVAKYKIEMDKSEFAILDPRYAVRYIKDIDNFWLKARYQTKVKAAGLQGSLPFDPWSQSKDLVVNKWTNDWISGSWGVNPWETPETNTGLESQ